MRKFLCGAVVCLAALPLSAIDGVPEGPPPDGWTTLLFYTGSNLEYVCQARGLQPNFSYRRSDSTITSITDSGTTSTAVVPNHGLAVGNAVTISGATVDTDLNGTYYVQTVADADTFTITTANVSDAAYTESTLVITTTAPRDTAAIWSVQKLSYDGSDNLIRKQWASGSSTYRAICANRATTTGATKVTWQ